MTKKWVYVLGLAVIAAVAAVYWPIMHANFVWDDWQSFHDKPWLTEGDHWKQAIFSGFNDWVYYFRPFVIALFLLEIRLFGSVPAPMHAVSLMLHLANVMLVGMLAWQCAKLARRSTAAQCWLSILCMAIYGFHPALIESVAWIGCQFDLTTTLLTLLGLLANLSIRRAGMRAVAVAVPFFLAACSKESAVAFPLLLVVLDWIVVNQQEQKNFATGLSAVIHRNWPVYIGILFAGILYLALRAWALGSLLNNIQPYSISAFGHLQLTSFLYLHYWKIILWPIAGMSPIHPYDVSAFSVISPLSIATTVAAVTVVGAGLYASIRHRHPIGYLVIAVTAALFPVLQIIPGQFEVSLFHERYAVTAVAVTCFMLPLLKPPARLTHKGSERMLLQAAVVGLFFWLSFSIIDIRFILPRWSNDTALWEWGYATNPDSDQAQAFLLIAYTKSGQFDKAAEFADELLASPKPCLACMIEIAKTALANDDLNRANRALQKAFSMPMLKTKSGTLQTYYQLQAQLFIQENDLDDAEKTIRTAIRLQPNDPKSKKMLDKVLALKAQAGTRH